MLKRIPLTLAQRSSHLAAPAKVLGQFDDTLDALSAFVISSVIVHTELDIASVLKKNEWYA
jgi:hypothetical protein